MKDLSSLQESSEFFSGNDVSCWDISEITKHHKNVINSFKLQNVFCKIHEREKKVSTRFKVH